MENKENNRSGDQCDSHFRSGRFYSISNKWYFCVREKEDQGPFSSKLSAEEGLKTYLMDYAHFNPDKKNFNINKLKLI